MKMVQSNCTSCCLIRSDLVAITGILFARKSFSKLLEQASIISELQANENIRGNFPVLVTLKS